MDTLSIFIESHSLPRIIWHQNPIRLSLASFSQLSKHFLLRSSEAEVHWLLTIRLLQALLDTELLLAIHFHLEQLIELVLQLSSRKTGWIYF